MAIKRPTQTWIRRFQKGKYHRIPAENFYTKGFESLSTLFSSRIASKPIDLYVYNADSGDMLFGRANLSGGYSRDLAHHNGLVRHFLRLSSPGALEKFSQGSLDIAVNHDKKIIFFKHLTLGLEDMLFPQELEWLTHIGSLQDLAMKALMEIGMPPSYQKSVVKASQWARIRTGLMKGVYIPYEDWKKRLKGGKL